MQGCAIVLGTTSNNIQHTRASKTQIRLKERKTNDKKKKNLNNINARGIYLFTSLFHARPFPIFDPRPTDLNQNCDLKLCDFGLSRGVQDEHETGDLTE